MQRARFILTTTLAAAFVLLSVTTAATAAPLIPLQAGGELVVFSLADPTSPERVFNYAYSSGSFLRPGDLVVIGDSLILSDPDPGVYSIDVSDPLAPTVDSMLSSCSFRYLAVTGTHLVGWGAGFVGFSAEVIDLGNPAVPATVGY